MAAVEFGAIAVACAAMATGDAPGGAVGVTRVGASARVGVAAARDRRICWLVPSPGDRRLCSASTAAAVVVVVAGPRWWRDRGAESERGVGRWLGSRTGGSDGATVTTKTLAGVRFQMRYSPNGSCISLQGNGVIKAQRAFSLHLTLCVCVASTTLSRSCVLVWATCSYHAGTEKKTTTMVCNTGAVSSHRKLESHGNC